ncbi:MAG: hypothetical protein AAF564_21505 [Bacteroidota bacterium]
MAQEIDRTGQRALIRAFDADESQLVGKSIDEIRSFLINHITRLLDQNPAHLMSILYRIDVREPDVKAAIATAPTGELPAQLATLIIDRQLEKLKYRK